MTKQQLIKLSSKLVNKFGDEILNEDFDFYSNLTTLIESGEINDVNVEDAKLLQKISTKIALNEYKDSAMGMIYETLNETDYVIGMLNESKASEKARRMGLVHVGFGWYKSKKNDEIYRSTGEKLVKASQTKSKKSEKDDDSPKAKIVGNSAIKKTVKSKKSDDSEDAKTKSDKTAKISSKLKDTSKDASKKSKAKMQKELDKNGIHITDLRRVDPVKFIFAFKLNGVDQEVELHKDEYSSEKPIIQIIYNKIVERKFEKGKFTGYEKTSGRFGMRKSYTGKRKQSRHFDKDEIEDIPAFAKKHKSNKKSEK